MRRAPGYFPLSATGPNTVYSHYHRGLRKLQDGDIVQFDYAPDLKYYTSDISRVFPANGRFSPRQRELYTIYLRLYQALMAEIKPGVPIGQVASAAGKKMAAIIDGFTFTDPKIREAATKFAAQYQTRQAAQRPRPRPRDGSARRRPSVASRSSPGRSSPSSRRSRFPTRTSRCGSRT